MINLKKIETELQYNIFKNSENYIEPNVCYITNDKLVHYNKYTIIDYSKNYLTFTPIEDSTFQFSKAGLSYSLDNGSTWIELSAATDTPTVAAGNKILWKNNTELTPNSNVGIGIFSSSKNFNTSGNIMSLLFGDNFVGQTNLSSKDYAFYNLFNTGKVVDASNLILAATTLSKKCYADMFISCKSLTSAPELPATTLENACYWSMFESCKSLTSAPELPATTLARVCYTGMLRGCTSLIYVKMLATDISAESCLLFWLTNVSSTGTFVKAVGTEIPSGANGIPEGWVVETVNV